MTLTVTDLFCGAGGSSSGLVRECRTAERRAEAPVRDCRHSTARHQHGTRAAYVFDRCRCAACRTANRLDQRDRAKAAACGRPSPFVDAIRARQHVHTLTAAGLGVRQIERLSGVSRYCVRSLLRDGADTSRGRRVRAETEQRLLAVTVDRGNLAGGCKVDATGTRRRVQALATLGWSHAHLARLLGRSSSNVAAMMRADHVTVATADAVRALYDELWATRPQTTSHAHRIAAARTRNRARRLGWLPPLAWDDIDTDTAAAATRTDTLVTGRVRSTDQYGTGLGDGTDLDEIAIDLAMSGEPVRLTPAESLEVVRRLSDRGFSVRQIAERLGTTTRTITRRRSAIRAA